MRKNPDNKMLRIVGGHTRKVCNVGVKTYATVLSNLAIAESNLVRAGKDSAMPHFIAIVKELERVCCFGFEIIEESDE